MNDYTLLTSTIRLIARCEQDLAAQARSLLERFAAFTDPAPHEGMVVEFGWAPLQLLREGTNLVISEPDFSGNPFRDRRPSVDTTLRVLAGQVDLLRRHQMDGSSPHFDQKVIINSCDLGAGNLSLDRQVPDRPDDSGWSIQDSIGDPTDAWSATYVFKLAVEHPWLTSPLALSAPVQCLLKNREVVSILQGPSPSD